jgi:DNA-directed RNA polymerase specialized sigma24 family protein
MNDADSRMIEQFLDVEQRIIALAGWSRQSDFGGDDLFQQLWIKVQTLAWDWSESQRGRLIALARNVLCDRARRKKCWLKCIDSLQESRSRSEDLSSFEKVAQQESRELLAARVDLLPLSERDAVRKRLDSTRLVEPSNKSTSRTAYHRAKKRLHDDPRMQLLWDDMNR